MDRGGRRSFGRRCGRRAAARWRRSFPFGLREKYAELSGIAAELRRTLQNLDRTFVVVARDKYLAEPAIDFGVLRRELARGNESGLRFGKATIVKVDAPGEDEHRNVAPHGGGGESADDVDLFRLSLTAQRLQHLECGAYALGRFPFGVEGV